MADPKPIASLSAGLLARKGAARPAMRRQLPMGGFASLGGNAAPALHDDLGWNDMGYDVDPVAPLNDEARAFDHGLTPMGVDEARDTRRELEDALEQSHTPSPVAPIAPAVSLPGPVESPAAAQQAAIAASLARTAPPVSPTSHPEARPQVRRAPRCKPGMRGAFAFTLRLDPDRHLRLRLASAAANLSSQQLLCRLLDEYLSRQPAALAASRRDDPEGQGR